MILGSGNPDRWLYNHIQNIHHKFSNFPWFFHVFSHDFPGFSHDFPVTSHEIVAQISFSVTSRISSMKRPTPRWATAAWDGWPPASWTGEAAERRWDAPKMVSSLTKIGDLSNKLVIYPRKLVIYPRKLVIDPTKIGDLIKKWWCNESFIRIFHGILDGYLPVLVAGKSPN